MHPHVQAVIWTNKNVEWKATNKRNTVLITIKLKVAMYLRFMLEWVSKYCLIDVHSTICVSDCNFIIKICNFRVYLCTINYLYPSIKGMNTIQFIPELLIIEQRLFYYGWLRKALLRKKKNFVVTSLFQF